MLSVISAVKQRQSLPKGRQTRDRQLRWVRPFRALHRTVIIMPLGIVLAGSESDSLACSACVCVSLWSCYRDSNTRPSLGLWLQQHAAKSVCIHDCSHVMSTQSNTRPSLGLWLQQHAERMNSWLWPCHVTSLGLWLLQHARRKVFTVAMSHRKINTRRKSWTMIAAASTQKIIDCGHVTQRN